MFFEKWNLYLPLTKKLKFDFNQMLEEVVILHSILHDLTHTHYFELECQLFHILWTFFVWYTSNLLFIFCIILFCIMIIVQNHAINQITQKIAYVLYILFINLRSFQSKPLIDGTFHVFKLKTFMSPVS